MEITENFIKENKGKRFTVTFVDGRVFKNIKFFVSDAGVIAYLSGRQKRRGYAFPIYDKISSVVEVKKKECTDIGNAKRILKLIHKNVWVDIQDEMKNVINGGEITQEFEWHWRGKLNIKNITKYLYPSEKMRLKRAFENKERFTWRKDTTHHAGRDLSISCEIGADGKFRAFFSSEYMGCGNGDYWLLLNPTTAIYYERD